MFSRIRVFVFTWDLALCTCRMPAGLTYLKSDLQHNLQQFIESLESFLCSFCWAVIRQKNLQYFFPLGTTRQLVLLPVFYIHSYALIALSSLSVWSLDLQSEFWSITDRCNPTIDRISYSTHRISSDTHVARSKHDKPHFYMKRPWLLNWFALEDGFGLVQHTARM